MKKRMVRGVVLSLFVLLSLLGCAVTDPARTQSRDDLASGAAKAYVKLYYLRSEGIPPGNVEIYLTDKADATYDIHLRKNDWKREGTLTKNYRESQDEVSLRVVKKPGMYKYVIMGESLTSETIDQRAVMAGSACGDIPVRERMITPIKIRIVQSYKFSDRKNDFALAIMRVTVEQPIPFVPDEPKK